MGVRNLMQSIYKSTRPAKKTNDYKLYYELVKYFPLQKIVSKSQHMASIKLLNLLLGETRKPDKGLRVYIHTLAQLVEAYENNCFNNFQASGVEMLYYLMDLKNIKQSALAPVLGGQSVVSNILNKRRELNIRQIKKLAQFFKVPAHVFV